LLGDRAGRRRDSAAACARDVRVLAGGRMVGAHPRAEANRPPVPAVGALRRARPAAGVVRGRSRGPDLSLAEAGVEANALAESGNERDLAKLRAAWAEELEASARSADHIERAAAYRAVGQFR